MLGFEPRSSDSESEVLTTTPYNRKKIMFTQLFEMFFLIFKRVCDFLKIESCCHLNPDRQIQSLKYYILFHTKNTKNTKSRAGFEPRSSDSKSEVLTTKPHNQK